jgi:hypothetical protein
MLTGELLLLPGGRRRHLKKQKNMRGRAPYFSISTSLESPNQYGIFFFGPNGLVKVWMEPVLKSSCPAYKFTTRELVVVGFPSCGRMLTLAGVRRNSVWHGTFV